MKLALFNFDHGSKYPVNYCVGPFTVQISNQHCDNLLRLPLNELITYGYDNEFNHVVKTTPKKKGGWVETATIEISEADKKKSAIFPTGSTETSISDLCLLLSFSTGRIVTCNGHPFGNEISPNVHADKVVYSGYFQQNAFNWTNLGKLKELGLDGQFYNLIISYQSTDFVAKAVHNNNSLNVAYEKWFRRNPVEFLKKKERDSICKQVDLVLENSKFKEDITARLNNIFYPSAIFKLKYFLRGIGIYPEYDTPEIHKRLKFLNTVRNAFAHYGMLPSNTKLKDKILGSATAAIIEMILRINQYYFAKEVLGLSDPYLNFIKKLIIPYFIEGKFGGHDLFNEDLQEYLNRVEQEWLDTNP